MEARGFEVLRAERVCSRPWKPCRWPAKRRFDQQRLPAAPACPLRSDGGMGRQPRSPLKSARPEPSPVASPARRHSLMGSRLPGPLWILLLTFVGVCFQLRVGLMGGGSGAGTVLRGPAAPTMRPRGRLEAAKAEYRRLHSAQVEVDIDSLHCDRRLTAETEALLALQLREERAAVAAASAGRLPQPPFLAAGGGPHKQCRAAPRGPDSAPSLHRVALLTPNDSEGLAWAQDPVARAARRQHLRHRQLLQPSVMQEAAGDSGSSGEAAAVDITLVTQLSIDRLPALQQQCRSWAGPTAAVVYAPLVGGRLAGLDVSDDAAVAALEGGTPVDALDHVRQAYRSIASLGSCRLTLELVVEERCDERLAGLWPINANRNRALLLAATPAVLLADVDFLVGGRLSPSLRAGAGARSSAPQRRQLAAAAAGDGDDDTSAALAALAAAHAGSKNSSSDDAWLSAVLADAAAEGKGWLEAVLSQNAAVVLPAFEAAVVGRGAAALARGAELAEAAAAAEKRGLAGMVVGQSPTVAAFQQAKYERGHRATRTWWWLQTGQPYAVDYWHGFEPFVLMPAARTPLYDERFRGYGWDKHVHTLHAVRQLGMKLVVHPGAWLVHQPHRRSTAQVAARSTGQRARLHDLFMESRRRILNNRFTPVSAFSRLCGGHARAPADDGSAGGTADVAHE